jgi:hypothetical protein
MNPGSADIDIGFHGDVGVLANGTDWYYGLMEIGHRLRVREPALHEVAHDLGFDGFINGETGGSSAANAADPYVRHI